MGMQTDESKGNRERKVFDKTLRVNLGEEMAEKFNALKKHYGIETDTEMVRMLIQKCWREEINK